MSFAKRFFSYFILLATLYTTTNSSEAATLDEFKTSYYNGRITPEAVEKFIAAHSDGAIKKLVISSEGGDLHAGLKLGGWVKRLGLDIEVNLLCQSACANYVSTAGKKKIIGPGALVLWHGSAEQKKLRDLHLKYQTILGEAFQNSSAISTEDRKFVDDNRITVESLMGVRETQARFFDSVEVNEYITRLGQEPVSFGIDSWTATTAVMEKFGIRNVEAPANYGSLDYLRRIPTSGIV
jgi:hypothetical protein